MNDGVIVVVRGQNNLQRVVVQGNQTLVVSQGSMIKQ
jgi:hypothetical protein